MIIDCYTSEWMSFLHFKANICKYTYITGYLTHLFNINYILEIFDVCARVYFIGCNSLLASL